MDTLEIIDRLEEIIKNESEKHDENEQKTEEHPVKNSSKDIIFLVFQFFLNIIKAPFNIIARYFKDELVKAMIKDARIYALIMGIMGVLFVFFSVLWLFVSVAVGVYFYDKGCSVFLSVIYSIVFQAVSFIIVGLIAFVASKKSRSIKMMRAVKNYKK